jgi:excisionase family DNA binding protein
MAAQLDFRDVDWVAEQLNIDKNAVYRYLSEGVLPGLQLGRKWLISESTLVEHLKAEEKRQTEERRRIGARDSDLWRRFERYSPRARGVVSVAHAEAVRRGLTWFGQEHLLYGIAMVPGSVGLLILERTGISHQKFQREVEAIMPTEQTGATQTGTTDVRAGEIEPTERARAALALAADEARQWKHGYVGVEHLLIGILVEGQGVGAQLLGRLGLTVDGARVELKRHLDGMTIAGYAFPADAPKAPYPVESEQAASLTSASSSASEGRGASAAP